MPCTYNRLILELHCFLPPSLRPRPCGSANVDLYKAGDSSGEETPVPIPNTVVKLTSSDGTWTQPGPGRVARCRTIKDTPLNGCVFVWVEF